MATSITSDEDSHPLTRRIHPAADKDSVKHKLGKLLESRWADIFILCLVIFDVGLLSIEHGIDSGMFCIDGKRVPAPRLVPPAGGGPAMPLASALPVRMPEGSAFVVPAGYDLALRPRREPMAEPPPPLAAREPPGEVVEASPEGAQPLLPPPGDAAAAAASRIAAAYPDRVALQGPRQPQEEAGARGEPPLVQEPEHPATHLFQISQQLGPQVPGEQLLELQAEASGLRLRKRHAPKGDEAEMVRMCEPREGHYSHQLEHSAHMLSVGLLAIMLIEILLKLWVHPGEFLRNPLEVLDLFIVSVSLFVDAILIPLISNPLNKAHAEIILAILLICRIWRIARILHGIVQVVTIQREHSQKLQARIKVLEKKEGELAALQQELQRDQMQAPGAEKAGKRRN